jgi:hypothetical protein
MQAQETAHTGPEKIDEVRPHMRSIVLASMLCGSSFLFFLVNS